MNNMQPPSCSKVKPQGRCSKPKQSLLSSLIDVDAPCITSDIMIMDGDGDAPLHKRARKNVEIMNREMNETLSNPHKSKMKEVLTLTDADALAAGARRPNRPKYHLSVLGKQKKGARLSLVLISRAFFQAGPVGLETRHGIHRPCEGVRFWASNLSEKEKPQTVLLSWRS